MHSTMLAECVLSVNLALNVFHISVLQNMVSSHSVGYKLQTTFHIIFNLVPQWHTKDFTEGWGRLSVSIETRDLVLLTLSIFHTSVTMHTPPRYLLFNLQALNAYLHYHSVGANLAGQPKE